MTRPIAKVAYLLTATLALLLSGCDRDGVTETGRLIIWTTESDPKAGGVMSRLEADFEKQNPGVDVVVETVSWNDLSERLINASQSGDWPDVSHIQPFMAYPLYSQGQLLPITDVRDAVERQNGPIFPAVRDLQVFGDKKDVYGLAYAVGTTFWSVLADGLPPGQDLSAVRTWDDYLRLAEQSRAKDPQRNRVTLPGGSPFFMDQLFGELVANAGGRLFDDRGCPLLTSPPSLAALGFLQKLKAADVLANDWPSQTYADQFARLANRSVFSAPVTYGRAAQTVRDAYQKAGRNPADANDRTILWLDQPTARAGQRSIATIDAEPWVVFRAATRRQNGGKTNDALAKQFLRMFYSPDYYLAFTRQVPVHLTPIFERLATDPRYVSSTSAIPSWHKRTLERLRDGSTRPILMPDLSPEGRSLPFLLEFQRANILSGAMSDVLQTDNSVQAAAERAQLRALQLVRRSGNRRCDG